MQKFLWIVTLLVAGLLVPGLRADTYTDYTFNFMGPSGTLFPTAGSFIYDDTAGAINPFSDFTVNWDGESFDYTTVANQYDYLFGTHNLASYFIPPSSGCTGPSGNQSLIVVLTTCTADARWAASGDTTTNEASFSIEYNATGLAFPFFVDILDPSSIPPVETSARPGFSGGGGGLPLSLTSSPVPAPEPGVVGLLLLGLGILVATRKMVFRPAEPTT
jgi:hypothetical protein